MIRPVVGITMCLDNYGYIQKGIEYDFVRREYGEAVRRAGGEPIFLDPSIDPVAAISLCDGLVISGGQDIVPSEYGQDARYAEIVEPIERTRWERHLIRRCDEKGIPIFGVCYGAQLLNVHYGGTLYQDVYKEGAATISHGSSLAPARHKVTFAHDFLGFSEGQTAEVTARHHQAVNQLAPGFTAIATTQDGIVEAIAGHGHYGVQWHAESDDTSATLYGEFVKRCEKVRKKPIWQTRFRGMRAVSFR